jgi:hypothetical protein
MSVDMGPVRRIRSARPIGLFLALLVSAIAPCRLAFAQTPTGSVRGVVQDSTGGRLGSAHVSAQAAGSAVVREVQCDRQGEFRLDELLPGVYRVSVSAPNFSPAISNVTVVVSGVREVTVTLQPAAVQAAVTVRGVASSISTQPLDRTTAVEQGVVTEEDLRTIPLAHRTFANISFLVPGTAPVEPSDPTKARITAVSFGGSSGLNAELSVDGGDNSDDYIGGFLQNFSPNAIQEFAVRTALQEADTGRTTGGSVVITTKSGTNRWLGDVSFDERAARLNARLPIDNPAPDPKQPFSAQNYSGTAGGPIRKDHLWLFSSVEYGREQASIAYSPTSLDQFSALASLAAQGLIPGVTSIPTPATVPVPFRDYLGSGRLDWAQSPRSQWFVRISGDQYRTNNDLVQQGTLSSTGATSDSRYINGLVSNHFVFGSNWLGSFLFGVSRLHHTETRNQDLGFALAFPFSSTAATISGFETFGDNQFVTPITAFPVVRDQNKYQFRYDLLHQSGRHALRAGVNLIDEPVLNGALSGAAENLTIFAMDPVDYLGSPHQFAVDLTCTPTATMSVTPGTTCSSTPAGDGSFAQSVQRLGLYVEDSWRMGDHLTINYGLRYDTTFGLFMASGRSQLNNPALLTLQALSIRLVTGAPHDYRGAVAPRIGIAYAPGSNGRTVIRAGAGVYYNDLAQNGWVRAFQAVNAAPLPCVQPSDPGCLPGSANGGSGAVIDPNYKTPYAFDASVGIERALNANWLFGVDFTDEEGRRSYRPYNYVAGVTLNSPLFASDPATQMANVPDITVFRNDNRSRYDALAIHLQGNVSGRFNIVANYSLSKASTYGCVLGELFDYVNGVCNPLNGFESGDYGPSGEDVRHRFVLAGTIHAPGGFDVATLTQLESARPFTLTTPVDVNGFGDSLDDRAVVNGVQTTLDEFRGTPYIQVDLRVSRAFTVRGRTVTPFLEIFNLFNRSNPGANYVTSLAALPVNSLTNATAICLNAACTQTQPITSLNQLRVPAGALGDFFGPGTTVGIPFSAQVGFRLRF